MIFNLSQRSTRASLVNETSADTKAKVWMLCLCDGLVTFAGKVLIMTGYCLPWSLKSAFTAALSLPPYLSSSQLGIMSLKPQLTSLHPTHGEQTQSCLFRSVVT